jgi:hypothetical protein
LYAPSLRADAAATHALAARVETGDVVDGMTVRDIDQREWSGLNGDGQLSAALRGLTALGWLRIDRREAGPKGGRPSDVVRLHPELRSVRP